MKGFFDLFMLSLGELTGNKGRTNALNIVVAGMLMAVSMAIESLTIQVSAGLKINFAFLAIAAIGMLFGPSVAFFAGGMCDVLGYLVHPDGPFLPIYSLIGCLQGLIYGLVLYRRWGKLDSNEIGKGKKYGSFAARLVTARLLDVFIINLCLNTMTNMHYGFIPQQAFGLAVKARFLKNALELLADIPLLFILMPLVLGLYERTLGRNANNNLKRAE